MGTNIEDTNELTQLGSGKKLEPSKNLEAFPNRSPDRQYLVTLKTDEFTCLCPKTGQPDFAKIRIDYVPDQKIVESKSLKLYFWSFRNEGVFHEHLANVILDDLVGLLEPHYCSVVGFFNIRGGISIDVKAAYGKTTIDREKWDTYLKGTIDQY